MSDTHTPAQPVIAPDTPFGYFCDWGNNSKLYIGEPGNAIDDDWNKQPSVHKNLPLFVKQPERIFEIALLKVLAAVLQYLPPDGIASRDAIAQIIAIVDPWPDATTPQPAPAPWVTLTDDEIAEVYRAGAAYFGPVPGGAIFSFGENVQAAFIAKQNGIL